jgi:hypothetical protein
LGFVVPTLAHKTRKNGAASVKIAAGEKPGARRDYFLGWEMLWADKATRYFPWSLLI